MTASPDPPPWNDRTKAAFDAARDSSKQVLTLTTAVLALSITFIDKIVGLDTLTPGDRARLQWTWVIYGLSVLAGVWTLLALTGSTGSKAEANINAPNVRLPALLQMLTFVGGTAMFILFAAMAM